MEKKQEALVTVNQELAAEFIDKTMTQVKDAIHKKFAEVFGISLKKFDPFTAGEPTPEGTATYHLKSMSLIVKEIATAEQTDSDWENNKELKKEFNNRKRQLIDLAKVYNLGDYLEAGVRAMGYRSTYKTASAKGELTFGLQPDKMFNNDKFVKFAADERKRVIKNQRQRDRARALKHGPAEELAEVKRLHEKGTIDVDVEVLAVIEGRDTLDQSEE